MIFLLQERTSPKPASKKIKLIPAIEVRPKAWKLPRSSFDYVIVSSPRALLNLKKWPQAKNYIAIGRATAKSLKKCPFKVIVLKTSNSAGILNFFKSKSAGRIFFPRSPRSDSKLVRELRALGHQVHVRHTYQTHLLPLKSYSRLLFGGQADAIMISSPSCFQALEKSFGLAKLRRLDCRWVAIGPTTSEFLRRRLGLKPLVAKEPSWTGMLSAFLTSLKKNSKH